MVRFHPFTANNMMDAKTIRKLLQSHWKKWLSPCGRSLACNFCLYYQIISVTYLIVVNYFLKCDKFWYDGHVMQTFHTWSYPLFLLGLVLHNLKLLINCLIGNFLPFVFCIGNCSVFRFTAADNPFAIFKILERIM